MEEEQHSEKKSKSIFTWSNVGNWLPAITIIAILIGYLNQYIFYAQFGLPIYNFIEVSEILLLFFPLIISHINGIVLSIITMAILILFFQLIESTNKKDDTKQTDDSTFENDRGDPLKPFNMAKKDLIDFYENLIKWKLHISLLKLFTALISILIALPLTILMNFIWVLILYSLSPIDDRYSEYRWEFGLVLLALMFIIASFEAFIYTFKKYIYRISNKIINSFLNNIKLLAYLILFFYLNTIIQTRDIKRGQGDFNVQFTYDNQLVKTDSSLVYIGSTQKYMFLRDIKKHSTRVFKVENTDNLVISKREYEYIFFEPLHD